MLLFKKNNTLNGFYLFIKKLLLTGINFLSLFIIINKESRLLFFIKFILLN